MTLLEAPPIAATDTISPIQISTIHISPSGAPGKVFDFGNNMAGFARMRTAVALPPGTVVTLKYGEVLKSDGSVSLPWGDGPGINNANQTDQYTFRGEAEGEEFTPSFTYHGFRYVQVDGLPASFEVDSSFLTALFVRTAIARSGDVHFGPAPPNNASSYRFGILNEIQSAIVQTQKSNVHSHPTDCPQREKRGWTGDGQVTSGTCALNFDAVAMYSTWLQSMEDSATIGCALAPKAPAFPQPECFECCNPKKRAFGCDYTGLPSKGGFTDVQGSVADVVPYMHVGGWPGVTSPRTSLLPHPSRIMQSRHISPRPSLLSPCNLAISLLPCPFLTFDVVAFYACAVWWPGDPSWGIAGATIPYEVVCDHDNLITPIHRCLRSPSTATTGYISPSIAPPLPTSHPPPPPMLTPRLQSHVSTDGRLRRPHLRRALLLLGQGCRRLHGPQRRSRPRRRGGLRLLW